MIQHPRVIGLVLLLCVWAGMLWSPVRAQPAATPAADLPREVRYRRVYVPQEAISEFTRGYMPIRREVFDRFVEPLRGTEQTPPAHAGWIRQAEYRASFADGELVDGAAVLTVEHRTAKPALLTLDPCSLAIGAAVWHGSDGPQGAIVGTDVAGQLVVLVPAAGQLHIPWSLRGETAPWGGTRLAFALPRSPRNRLVLDLPPEYVLQSDHGLVFGPEQIGATDDATLPDKPLAQRWTIELGGANQFMVSIGLRDMVSRRQQVGVRQDTVYRLETDSLELECNFALDAPAEPVTSVSFSVDGELQITQAQWLDRDVPWSVLTDMQGRPQVTVRFPVPLTGLGQPLRIKALGPLQTDRAWTLPRLLPQEAAWQHGTLTLQVPRSLEVRQLEATNASQAAAYGPAAEADAAQTRFHAFSPESALKLIVSRAPRLLAASVGTTLELESGTITARVVADLLCPRGERFVVEAEVPTAWTVDGIESQPANVVESHQIVSSGTAGNRVRVQLSTPLAADRPLRLIVRAHRPLALALQPSDWRPFQLTDVSQCARVVAIVPSAGYRLDLTGDEELLRWDTDRLSASERERVAPQAGSLVFADNQHADRLVIRLTREDPTFGAAIHVTAEMEQNGLTELYRIVCTPDAAPVGRLLIHLSETRDGSVEWTLTEEANNVASARLLRDDQTGRPRPGRVSEIWEVVFRTPIDRPFTVQGRRNTRGTPARAVALASLPSASSQDGWLTIRSRDGTPLQITANSVTAIPGNPSSPGDVPTVRARFRYDPSENAQVSVEQVSASEGKAAAWAWNCVLTSQFLPHGEATHHATYLLESVGAQEFAFELPASCRLERLEIDGEDMSRAVRASGEGTYTVALPAGKRFPRLRISFAGDRGGLGQSNHLVADFPQVKLPVLDRRWSVWLPPGYEPPVGRGETWPVADGPYCWRQRLFGFLARPTNEPPFHLLAADDWSALWGRGRESRLAAERAELFLQLLGEELLGRQSARPDSLPWRELLEGYLRRAEQRQSVGAAWVEAGLLAEEGFSLDGPVPTLVPNTPAEIAADLFVQARLVVIADRDGVLLTSVDGLSRDHDRVSMSQRPMVAVVRPHHAGQVLRWDTAGRARPGVLPVSSWVARPAPPSAPWAGQREMTRAGVLERPWRVYEVSPNDTGGFGVQVVRTSVWRAWGWGSLLLSAGLVWWCALRRPHWISAWLLTGLLIAMLAPDALVPITSQLMLGSLAGCGVWRLFAAWQPVRSEGERSGVRLAQTAVLIAIGLGVIGLTCRNAVSDEPAETSEIGPSLPTHDVIVPVDRQWQPVGQYDYLPLALYDELHQRRQDENGLSAGWLVRRATYLARFQWKALRTSLELTSLTAIYQLESLRPSQRISLPWDGDSRDVQLLEARLAGQPVELEWSVDRKSFSVPIPSAGSFQLELVLRPETRDQPGSKTIRFAIPVIAQSELHVQSVPGAPPVDVVSAGGSLYVNPELGEQHAELGPAPVLELRWPSGRETLVPSRLWDVQQLCWLKVRPKDHPQGVLLDVRLRVSEPAPSTTPLELAVDPRLKLIPAAASLAWSVTQYSDLATGENRLSIQSLGRGADDPLIPLQFSVEHTTGLGQLTLPPLQPLNGRVARRWLAISVAPELEYATGTSESLQPLDAAEFLALWGDAESAPSACFRSATADPRWELTVRPRKPRTEARQQCELSVARGAISVFFDAAMETQLGEVFQHRLSVPTDLVLETVEVTTPLGTVPLQAHHDGAGTITVFPSQGLTGKYQLKLTGYLVIAQEPTELTLPGVSLIDCLVRSHLTRVYRQPDVLVDCPLPHTASASSPIVTGSWQERRGRFVAAFTHSDEDGSPTRGVAIRVSPNEPHVEARLVTRLERAADQWEAVVQFEGHVSDPTTGVVDRVRFEIPNEWAEPFEVTPRIPYRIRSLPGPRRHLILEPEQPVSQRIAFTIRGKLNLGPQERGRAPNIVPLDMAGVERYFVLPTRWDQQRLEWKTSGLYRLGPGEAPTLDLGDSTSHVAYRVWSRPRAVIADIRRVSGQRQISVADCHVAIQRQGGYFGVVTYCVEPAGAASCCFEVPAAVELVRVTVEGIPAALTPLADRRWSVRLGTEQLPQQLTIMFRGQFDRPVATEPQELQVPWVTDFDVASTLWTLRGPPGAELLVPGAAPHQLDSFAQEQLRLRATASLIESAAETVLDRPADEVHLWYTPWAARWTASVARLARDQWTAGPLDETSTPDNARQTQQAIAQRIKADSTLDTLWEDVREFAQPRDLWSALRHPATTTTHYVFAGGTPVLDVVCQDRPASWQSVWPRWLLAITALLGLCTLATGRLAHPSLAAWLARWPAVGGVLIGLAWWQWATPSWLGWVVIAWSVWDALRCSLPSIPARTPASMDRSS